MVALQQERPAFVQFEIRDEEDRDASIKQGHYVGRDVDYVIVTSPGSVNTFEDRAENWLQKKRENNDPFYDIYKRAYEAFKEGQEAPTEGTSIRNWAALSPAQVKSLLSLNVRTIEDLANANESTLGRIGMGSRALQQRAVAYLESANGPGKISEEVAALRVQVEQFMSAIQEKDATIEDLKAQLGLNAQNNAVKQANRDKAPKETNIK